MWNYSSAFPNKINFTKTIKKKSQITLVHEFSLQKRVKTCNITIKYVTNYENMVLIAIICSLNFFSGAKLIRLWSSILESSNNNKHLSLNFCFVAFFLNIKYYTLSLVIPDKYLFKVLKKKKSQI